MNEVETGGKDDAHHIMMTMEAVRIGSELVLQCSEHASLYNRDLAKI
jgi:hypothetical protein